MGAATAQEQLTAKPALLFIDDEPRVLKSMRAMFRRDYDVYLANSGAEALDIVAEKPIQVIVSDQRMPHMTGVEVLAQVKHAYPHIVRILLTGYADLEAIEDSLNEAEVFRYLMKPCPADEVRAAVQAGLEQIEPLHTAEVIPLSSRKTEVGTATQPTAEAKRVKAPAASGKGRPESATLPVAAMTSGASGANRASARPSPAGPKGNLLLLGSVDLKDQLQSVAPKVKIFTAPTLADACAIHVKHPIGVLVADVGADGLESLSRKVRTQLPGVVTLTVSTRSDATLLINLINSGEVFRFLLKPVQAGRFKITLSAAFERFYAGAPEQLDAVVDTPSGWRRFVNWLLGRRA